jgi:hypothetical protein
MKIRPEVNCPLNNFKKCKGLECSWFIQMRGQNPNTGEDVDDWACAVAWLPTLLIENAQQSRQTGAAVESFRNEMVKAQEASVRVLAASKNLLQ